MKVCKKKIIGGLCALVALCCFGGGVALAPTAETAKAESTVLSWNFTDTMDGADFKAPASNYGWKVTKGVLAPDNTYTSNSQIGYLEQAIALNESKYISLDFYTSAAPMDIMLLPYAETVNPWATGVGVHSVASGWMRLDTYIDANTGWLADYTGMGNGVDGYAHKLEIASNGTHLTFKLDGLDAFTSATVAIPASSVQLVFRAPANSYIDNLYIASEKPADTAVVDVDFTDKTDLTEFSSMALNGWTGGDGKFHPADAGEMYNASATKFNTPIDLTGSKYISFDFFSTAATFDVGLLDTAATNIWGNALFIHMPFSDGNTIGINSYVDCTTGTYYDGMSINCIDGYAHTLEMFISGGKVAYALDGNALVGNGGTAQFNAPADSAYLVFRAVGTSSYIDNLYIADSAPTEIDYDFDTLKDVNSFTGWGGGSWTTLGGEFVASSDWASTQLKSTLDLTKNQEITFDVYLSSSDSNKQFNVGFFSEDNLANASSAGSGVGFSLGSTLWLGTNLGRQGWIADAAASLYNDAWHSVKISVENRQMTIALDGVAYPALTTAIPADTAYLLMQSTSTENALDNFKITEIATVTPEEPPVTDEYLGYTELDFSDEADGDTFATYSGSAGWSVQSGTYKANAAWASVHSAQKLVLTESKQISLEVFLPASDANKQFNIGFFATTNAETNIESGSGVNYSLGATLFYGSSFGRSHWVADVAASLYDDDVHTVVITVDGGYLSIAVDGTEYPTLKAAIPANEVYLLMQATSTETYVDNFVIGELEIVPPTPVTYTVTFKNFDGSILQSGTVTEGEMPVYAGETPVRAEDENYTYTFKGWDQELSAVTGDVEYVAQYDATEKLPDLMGDVALDFSNSSDGDLFTAYSGSAGWSVNGGVYKANAAWASVNSVQKLSLAEKKTITFDVYLSSSEKSDVNRQFNFGFFATTNADTNTQNGGGVNYSLGATLFYGSSFGRTQWVADVAADLYTDTLHTVVITAEGGYLSIAVDGTAYPTLTAAIPADEVYLLMQATSTETYVDNFTVADDILDELTLKFSSASQAAEYTEEMTNGGWVVKSGRYYPAEQGALFNASAFKVSQAISLADEKYISFDFYSTAATFDVGLLDVAAGNIWGNGLFIHLPYSDGTIGVTTNVDCTAGVYQFGSTANVLDGRVHNLKIAVADGKVAYYLDGAELSASVAAIPAEQVFVVFRAVGADSYIDNLIISDSDIEYVAPITYLEEASWDFSSADAAANFVELALGGWQVVDGKYAPTQSGAMNNASAVRTALPIDLTGTKYISLDFYSTAATFDIGFLDVSAANMWGNALFFHAPYSDGMTIGVDTYIDCGGTYIGGVAQNPMDGKAHNLLLTVVDGMVSFALDGVQLSFTANIPADTVYLVLRAVGTGSYIDNLTIGASEPMMGEFSLDFSESVSTKFFTTYYNNGWSAEGGKYVPYGVDSTVQTFYKVDMTENWDVRFDVYLTGAFNVGFFAEPTALDVGEGKSFAFGETLWLGSRFGRNNWLADVGVNLMDNSLHAVRITVLDGYISIAVDGISYNYVLRTAIPADAAYLLMQAADTNTYVDNFRMTKLTLSTLTVKNIQGETVGTESVSGYYTLPQLIDDSMGELLGYVYGGRVYRSSNEISVEEDGELIALFADFSMVAGAAIRMNAPTGMRFTSMLDADAYDYLQPFGAAQIGTLIAKADDVVADGDYSKLYYNNEYTHLNIVSTVGAKKDGYYVYNGVLANIKPSHFDWQFAARGYIKMTYFDGYELAFYTNGESRAVRDVAEMAYSDRSDSMVTDGEMQYLYLTEDGDYSPYNEQGRNVLLSFLVSDAVYVSTTGNDNYDGSTLARAVATFERAAALAQDSDNALILLCDGEYTVSQAAVLGSNVTVKSMTKNGATLSGAKKVDSSSITERTDAKLGRVWEIPYSEKINQLYINDSYGVRARYPDAGQELRLFNADETMRTISVFSEDIASFAATDFQGSVIVPTIQWAESYLRVQSLTEKTLSTGLALTDIRLVDEDSLMFTRNLAISPRTAYHFENSKAFLNARGEWFYDETAKKITYLPYEGETLENTTVRIPVTQTLVSLVGESGAKVSNVTFDGINFMYTKNGIIDGKIGGQANRNDAFEYANIGGMRNGRTDSAIEAEFVDSVTFKNNVFACMGSDALDFLQGVSNVTIENNLFRTVGGNGVLVGTLSTDAQDIINAYAADTSVINTNVNTVNNYFTEIGWQEYGSCAVVYTYASNSAINQNTINNVPYTGISLGWGWENLPVGAYLENNEIVGNRITNVMTALNDGGAIYLVGCQPNTYVAENYIANIYNGAYKYPVDLRDDAETEQYWWANAGIYLDTAAGSNEDATKVIVENNYIASDIENQAYEFCNVVNVPKNAVYAKYYFTIDGKTDDELSIYMSNGLTASDVSGAGASGISQLTGKTVLFGAHMLDASTLTVYGVGFGASYNGTLTVNGQKVSSSDVSAWTDGAITFTTSGLAGSSATVQVGESNRLYTAMNVDVAAELARFDGYIDVSDLTDWYTRLDVQKQAIASVQVSSGENVDYATDGLYYTSWEASEEDGAASITFRLKTVGVVDTFLLYDRIETNEEEAEYRKNIRIIGVTAAGGEICLYESGDAQAYDNFGMLELDMESLGYGAMAFSKFRIEKVGGGALSVADVAII